MKNIIWVFSILLAWNVALRADTHYVAPPGVGVNPSPNYTNWNIAATSILDAVGASSAGDTVLVSNGVYMLTNQITVEDLTVSSWRAGALDRAGTTVNGNYPNVTNRCFYLNDASAVVEGFTITNGHTWGNGRGVYVDHETLRRIDQGLLALKEILPMQVTVQRRRLRSVLQDITCPPARNAVA